MTADAAADVTAHYTADRVLLLTPPGVAAIAVVRMVGGGVERFLRQHFSAIVQAGQFKHGRLIDGDETIDDPLVNRISESMVDINLHGGLWLVQRVIDLATREGFEHVSHHVPLPAEAVDATSDLEHEMLAWLPNATTEAAVRLLLAQPAAWERLLRAPVDRRKIEMAMKRRTLHWMLNTPTVAIIGAPNVGKSTLANQLFGRARSITADMPGTTRDWVGEIANLDGLAVRLVDTPGMRPTEDAIEREAIERSRAVIGQAELIVIVSTAAEPNEALRSTYPDAIVVTNKMDRGCGPGINTNAISGEGVDELRAAIRARFIGEKSDLTVACFWTERQRNVLHAILV